MNLTKQQMVRDLGYVSFKPANGADIIIKRPGKYRVTHSIKTKEIAYFVVSLDKKIIPANSYRKGKDNLMKWDYGVTKIKVTTVPAILRLQNFTGIPVTISGTKPYSSVKVQKIG
jgi:hypothetical protein